MIVHWLSDPKDGAHMVVVGASGTLVVRDIVGRLAKAFDTKSNIVVEGGELRTFLIDSSHAQKNFKYTPMSLADLLVQFINDNR